MRCCTRLSRSFRVPLSVPRRRRRSVTSSNVPRMPMTSPSRSRNGTFWVSTQRRSPPARRRRSTIPTTGSPVSATWASQSMNQSAPNSASSAHGMSRSDLPIRIVRFGPGEGGEHTVAPEVPRLRGPSRTRRWPRSPSAPGAASGWPPTRRRRASVPATGRRRGRRSTERRVPSSRSWFARVRHSRKGSGRCPGITAHGQPVDLLEHVDVVVVRMGEPASPLGLHRALRAQGHDVGPPPRVGGRGCPRNRAARLRCAR